MVGTINSNNIVRIFGEQVYCLGAEKVSQVSKIRGASIKYCYCDELAEYNEEVWELLKSMPLGTGFSLCAAISPSASLCIGQWVWIWATAARNSRYPQAGAARSSCGSSRSAGWTEIGLS